MKVELQKRHENILKKGSRRSKLSGAKIGEHIGDFSGFPPRLMKQASANLINGQLRSSSSTVSKEDGKKRLMSMHQTGQWINNASGFLNPLIIAKNTTVKARWPPAESPARITC